MHNFTFFLFKEETKPMYRWHLRLNAIEKKYMFRKSRFQPFLNIYFIEKYGSK